MSTKIAITGAPGAGKTTILRWLEQKYGYSICIEPAREIIAEQRTIEGRGIWERDTSLFLELLLSRSIANWKMVEKETMLYDRGIVDCIGYACLAGINTAIFENAAKNYRYSQVVYVAEPWEEMYTTDDERTMDFAATMRFHEHLIKAYQSSGYQLCLIPRGTVDERAEFLHREIKSGGKEH